MESIEAKFPENPSLKRHKLVIGAQICWRIVAILTALAATWMIVTSKETVVVFGLQLDARYSYSSAYKFFAFANAFACGFTLLSLLFVFFFGRHGLTPTSYCSCTICVAAGTAIGYVGRYGNIHTDLRPFEQILPQGDHFYDTLVSVSRLLAGTYHHLCQQV
ncbi:hypothetical protein CRYUN_Cryun07bG0016400 [Craigia yunnanensis]